MKSEDDYYKAIHQATNIEELRTILIEVNERARNIDYRPRHIRMAVFNAIRDMIGEEYDLSHEFILQELWPLCIEATWLENNESKMVEKSNGTRAFVASRSSEDMLEANSARNVLATWVIFWTQRGYESLRNEIYGLARDIALKGTNINEIASACWVFHHIGWRNQLAEETLWEVLKRNDKAGDVASQVLASIGIIPEKYDAYITQLVERAKRRPTRYNSQPMVQLADPGLVDDALGIFFAESSLEWVYGTPRKQENKGANRDEKLWFIASYADALWDHRDIQEKIWKALYSTYESTTEGRWRLLISGNVMTCCHTSNVIQDFLSILPNVVSDAERKDSGKDEEARNPQKHGYAIHHPLYIAAERLRVAISPAQLSAWDDINKDALYPFRRLALLNTFQSGNNTTSPMSAKENAWRMLAFGGGAWSSEDLQEGIADESSRFVQGEVAQIAACFGCDPLPPITAKLLLDAGDKPEIGLELHDEKATDSSEFAVRRGLEDLARSTANRASFSILLNFGFIFRGEALLSTTDALQEVAVHLVRRGDTHVIGELWDATSKNNPMRKRIAALSALHGIAGEKLLPVTDWERFVPLAGDTELKTYFRALAVQAIGFFQDELVKGDAREHLVDWWQESRDYAALELSGRARESLARHGTWEIDKPDEYLNDLGLEMRDEEWRAKTNKVESNDMAALYFIYRKDPPRFRKAVCDIILSDRDRASYALVFWLIAREWGESVTLEKPVVDAMIEQLSKKEFDVPHYLFNALSIGSPERLLNYDWGKLAAQWQVGARVALANSFANTENQELTNEGRFTLETLMHDDSFAVRRSAIRAWFVLSPGTLAQRCLELAFASESFERQIAAEMVFWWKEPLTDQDGKAISEILLIDPEQDVRNAARESKKTQRERIWAEDYLEKIKSVVNSSESPGSAYAYGFALQPVGDDWTLRQLYQIDEKTIHPANRFWLREIRKGLDKKWKEKTRDWNLPTEGVLTKTLSGSIEFDKDNIEVQVSLWIRPAVGVRGVSSWGGYLKAESPESLRIILNMRQTHLSLSDGKSGTILLRNPIWTSQKAEDFAAHFSGNGQLFERES